MKDFFTTVETASMSEEQLMKALSAGVGTDAARFEGGRAMQPEDIEMTMVNAMREQREDCKMMGTLKKTPVKSTIHQFNRRNAVGNYEFLATEEGGGSETNDQQIERVPHEIKFLQDRRSVTDQMEVVDSFENAYESEKIAGTLNVLKAAEFLLFHGDASVVPEQFDGILRQIEKSKRPNIYDVRGKTIGAVGEKIITEPVRMVYDAGGDVNKLFMPPMLAQGIQDLIRDRIRFGTAGSSAMSLVVDQYPTAYGSTVHFGQTEGADKFFKVKGIVSAAGNVQRRPGVPANVTASSSPDGKSQFVTVDSGNYQYSVHAVNKYGISPGKELSSPFAVTAGNKVTLTITPSAENTETGYIICRSAKDGTVVMEMCRIGRDTGGTTTFDDFNTDLPGTAQMLFLTEKKLQSIVEWFQLLPLRVRPLYESNRAEKPFFVQLFGSVAVKVPEWCAIAKNIMYEGGLVY